MDAESYSRQVIQKKPLESKKWIMGLLGLLSVLLVYGSGLAVIWSNPETGTSVANLVGQVVTFLGAVVGAYTTGQSFVDWKAQSSLAAMVTEETRKLVVDVSGAHLDLTSRAKEDDYSTAVPPAVPAG